MAAIREARQLGRSVWLPPGRFHVVLPSDENSGGGTAQHEAADWIDVESVAIAGAGMWHTTLLGTTRFRCATNCSYADFSILGVEVDRRSGRYHAFEGAAGLEECRKCCGGHGVLLASGCAPQSGGWWWEERGW